MMKRAYLFFVTILVSSIFFSCSTLRVIDIESYKPSTITFPPEIKKVMVVNNSAQQPDNVGHRYISYAKSDSAISVSSDSTAFLFCMSLGSAMAESPVFDDVRICNDTLRTDSLFFKIIPFTPSEINYLCAEYGVDALISLDKLFFSTILYKNTKFNYMPLVDNSINVQVAGEIRVQWPGQKDVYIIPFRDSLSFYFDAFYELSGVLSLEGVKYCMHYVSEMTGQKMKEHLVPFWDDESRWYYKSITSEWKRGTAFASVEKWDEALKIWESLLIKSKKWKQKARLASNIALCYEMKGGFDKAIEYAEMSYGLFKEHDVENSSYTNIQSAFVDTLKKRKEDEEMLSIQLKEPLTIDN